MIQPKQRILRAVKILILIVFLCIGAFLLYFYMDGTYVEKEGSAGTMPGLDVRVTPTEEIVEYEEGFSVVRYDGDYGFDAFLAQGGAFSDGERAARILGGRGAPTKGDGNGKETGRVLF